MKTRRIIVNLDEEKELSGEIVSLADIIVFSPAFYTEASVSGFLTAARRLKGKAAVYLGLPVTANGGDIALLKEIIRTCRPNGLYTDNLYGLALAEEFGLPFIAGTGLNIYNSESAKYFLSRGGDFVYSAELNLKEIEEAEKNLPARGFIFVHGDMRAMTLNHCPSQVASGKGCGECAYKEGLEYEDEKGYRFPFRRVKVSICYFELYNSLKLSTLKKLPKKDINLYFVLFGLSAKEVCDIIKAYTGIGQSLPQGEYTSGHLFKGVT